MKVKMSSTTKMNAILDEMRELDGLVVAFSGGVDSAVVAAMAKRALGETAYAVTAVSETLAGRELEEAKEIADEIGIRHELVAFSELDDPRFRENTASRCFFCQSMRFDQLAKIADRLDVDVLASGTNFDDIGDHRPGLEAMRERRIYQPLLDHEVSKSGVRAIARELGLSIWDKPAAACLSSRIPHGIEVTVDRLRRIELAEDVLADYGFRQFRVRDHDGLARIEIGSDELSRIFDAERLRAIAREIKRAGFRRVTVDLLGYRTGSLNPIEKSHV